MMPSVRLDRIVLSMTQHDVLLFDAFVYLLDHGRRFSGAGEVPHVRLLHLLLFELQDFLLLFFLFLLFGDGGRFLIDGNQLFEEQEAHMFLLFQSLQFLCKPAVYSVFSFTSLSKETKKGKPCR